MWKEAVWLGIPRTEIEKWNILQGDMNGLFAYYRCEMEILQEAKLELVISANSKYRLWINQKPVLSGPCKGDRYRHFYDRIDVSNYLKIGKNVFAVQVLYGDSYAVTNQEDERTPLLAIASVPVGHRLAIEGKIKNKDQQTVDKITTGVAPWRIYLDGSFHLKSKEITLNLGAICEDIEFKELPFEWKTEDYNDQNWTKPEKVETVVPNTFHQKAGLYGTFRLKEREIPLLYETESAFDKDIRHSQILKKECLIIEKNETKELILDAGELCNAYMNYHFLKGENAKVTFTYSEKFTNPQKMIKITDDANGVIEGIKDEIILPGKELYYEPFWYRTFRFLRIEIQAEEEEVVIYRPAMRKTGYPLLVESQIKSSQSWVENLWDICVRTLERCMMDTYMDCPFYEQMQFPMDTRLQALFTYVVSNDTKLAKKALQDFHASMLPQGLIQGKYPCGITQVISTFSLHYIYMISEYYQQTGDMDIVKKYRSDMDAILEYYDSHMGSSRLIENLGFWEFVDWQDEWGAEMGVPKAALSGPSSIINLMYGYALQCAAELNELSGRKDVGKEYRGRQEEIILQIHKLCWSEEQKLFREGPKTEQYTQHAQAWAVLNGMVTREEGQELLQRALENQEVLRCSFSTGYELFRALETVGLYDRTQVMMQKWIGLLDRDCTTCPEEPENGRSECHAWSALPIYEMIRSIAGIKMGNLAWQTIRVHPHMCNLPDLSGQVITPLGCVQFDYRRTEHEIVYEVTLPEGAEGVFELENGDCRVLVTGKNVVRELM